MCETRRSEMPGQDSSARLKAFSSSSMAPIPPPHALLFSFSWRANRRTLNSTTYRAYHSLLHFTAALSTATVIKNDSVRVTVRCLIIYTRGESLRWVLGVFTSLKMGETSADRHCDLGCLFTVSAACKTNSKQNFTFHVWMSKVLVLQYKANGKIKLCKWSTALLFYYYW